MPVPLLRKITKELVPESNLEIDNPETMRVFKGSVISVFESETRDAENTIRAMTNLDRTKRKDQVTTLHSCLDG